MKKTIAALMITIISGLLLSACSLPGLLGGGTARVPRGEAVPNWPVLIEGSFEYTNEFAVEEYFMDHAVALLDMTGFVLRDREWEIPVEGQVLGYMDLDKDNNIATYRLSLPAVPYGQFNDVDNDNKKDQGLQIFAVGYNPNLTGGVFSEGDDRSRGWPGYLASVRTDSENQDEVTGGTLVIWAADGKQKFPSGFGDDGLLFTEDDPVTAVPAGYSIVNLDAEPFTFESEGQVVNIALYEPDDVAIKDFSNLSYTDAFEQLFTKARTEYAFNGYPEKEPDWETMYAQIQPRVAQAQKNKDGYAFFLALRDMSLFFNDGHVGVNGGDFNYQFFEETIWGGYGFAVRELDDGRVLVVFVLPGGPADLAGMQVGAELLSKNGQNMQTALENTTLLEPSSTDFGKRYLQTVMLTRSGLGESVIWGWRNRNGDELQAQMTAVYEMDSLFQVIYGGLFVNTPVLPVEASIIGDFIGYIKVSSNSDDLSLIIRNFEHALKKFEGEGIPALIIDMRMNGGGTPLDLAGFLHDKEIPIAQLEYYNEKTGEFEARDLERKVTPYENQYPFQKMVLLVDQFCASACEIEAYGFSQVPGMVVMGQFPTAGVEGETARGQFLLPEGIEFGMPTGRFVKSDGTLFLEGEGVEPRVRIAVDAESVLSDEDVVLQRAVDYILSN